MNLGHPFRRTYTLTMNTIVEQAVNTRVNVTTEINKEENE